LLAKEHSSYFLRVCDYMLHEMNLRAKTLKGSVLLTAGGGLVNCLSFVHNMILARVLTKADFGIAATLGLVITLIEFSAKLGVARFVVQDKEGHRPDFIAAAHLVQLSAGALGAVLMVASAPTLARFFGVEALGDAIGWLGLVALLRGLEHMDIRRYERDLRFGPSALAEAIPQLVITLAVWPVAVWLNDFRAVLVLLVSRSAVGCVMSHLFAERPYRCHWHREYVVRMFRFGWPLLATSFLMVGVMQGDQFLVASFYIMTDLAPYAAAAALVLAPSFLFGRVLSSLALPLLAKVQDDPPALRRRYRQIVAIVVTFSAVSSVGMVIGSEAVMQLVYGNKYVGSGVILAWLAGANAYRIFRMAPTSAALARGDSQNQLISNLWRVCALLPALSLALLQMPVWMLACCGLLGEALGCWASLLRLRRRDGIPFDVSLIPALWLTGLLVGAGLFAWSGAYHWPLLWALAAAMLASLLTGALLISVLPELRQEVGSAWDGFRVGGWRGALSRISGYTPVRKAGAL
jgi:O-antigen/teichoic acid export membrane protein